VKTIALKDGRQVLVDEATHSRFGRLKWHTDSAGYVVRDGEKIGQEGIVFLHRLVVGAQPGHRVRFKNQNRLDCRRQNLILVTQRQRRPERPQSIEPALLDFMRRFPEQQRFGRVATRKALEEVRQETGLTVPELLERIREWSEARANIAPWDLAKPAPPPPVWSWELPPQEAPRYTLPLVTPSPEVVAHLRAIMTPWKPDDEWS
jgi:hypothetical protein